MLSAEKYKYCNLKLAEQENREVELNITENDIIK